MCLFLEIISVFSFSFTLKIWGFNRGVDRKAGHRSCCWYDSKTMLLCWNYVKVEVCARRTPSRHPSEWPVQTGVFVCLPLGGPRHLRLFRRAADLIKPTFNPDQLISRQLMRCEQIGTGPCPAGTPQRGAGPPRTAVRLYNYMSFVWAWSVFPQGLSVRSFASAGMLLLLSCSSQHSHKVLLMCPVDFDFYIFLHRFVQKVQRVLNKNLQNVFFIQVVWSLVSANCRYLAVFPSCTCIFPRFIRLEQWKWNQIMFDLNHFSYLRLELKVPVLFIGVTYFVWRCGDGSLVEHSLYLCLFFLFVFSIFLHFYSNRSMFVREVFAWMVGVKV